MCTAMPSKAPARAKPRGDRSSSRPSDEITTANLASVVRAEPLSMRKRSPSPVETDEINLCPAASHQAATSCVKGSKSSVRSSMTLPFWTFVSSAEASKMTNVVIVFPRLSNDLVTWIVVTLQPPSLNALLLPMRARGGFSEKGPLSRRRHPECLPHRPGSERGTPTGGAGKGHQPAIKAREHPAGRGLCRHGGVGPPSPLGGTAKASRHGRRHSRRCRRADRWLVRCRQR